MCKDSRLTDFWKYIVRHLTSYWRHGEMAATNKSYKTYAGLFTRRKKAIVTTPVTINNPDSDSEWRDEANGEIENNFDGYVISIDGVLY